MIYLKAGLFAEGPTDYRFLMPLLNRLIHETAGEVLAEDFEVADTIGIYAPRDIKRREFKIPAAIHDYWGECTLFVVHSDGDGDPDGHRQTEIDPGIQRARVQHPDLAAAACVPVRELEAWMLADPEVFRKLLKGRTDPALPRDPEGELDPKKTVEHILVELGARLDKIQDRYAFFGANIRIEPLSRLPAFQRFKLELADAIRLVARPPK